MTIKLSDYLNKQLINRTTVNSIFEKSTNDNKIIADFSGIDFISRAAAHELLNVKEQLNKKNIYLSFTNINNEVFQMIAKVEKSKKTNIKSATFVNKVVFKNETELNKYLLSI